MGGEKSVDIQTLLTQAGENYSHPSTGSGQASDENRATSDEPPSTSPSPIYPTDIPGPTDGQKLDSLKNRSRLFSATSGIAGPGDKDPSDPAAGVGDDKTPHARVAEGHALVPVQHDTTAVSRSNETLRERVKRIWRDQTGVNIGKFIVGLLKDYSGPKGIFLQRLLREAPPEIVAAFMDSPDVWEFMGWAVRDEELDDDVHGIDDYVDQYADDNPHLIFPGVHAIPEYIDRDRLDFLTAFKPAGAVPWLLKKYSVVKESMDWDYEEEYHNLTHLIMAFEAYRIKEPLIELVRLDVERISNGDDLDPQTVYYELLLGALAKVEATEAIPYVRRFLDDPDRSVRDRAAIVLGELGEKEEAVAHLRKMGATDDYEAGKALTRWGEAETVQAKLSSLQEYEARIEQADPEQDLELVGFLLSFSSVVRMKAQKVFERLSRERAIPLLIRMLKSFNPRVYNMELIPWAARLLLDWGKRDEAVNVLRKNIAQTIGFDEECVKIATEVIEILSAEEVVPTTHKWIEELSRINEGFSLRIHGVLLDRFKPGWDKELVGWPEIQEILADEKLEIIDIGPGEVFSQPQRGGSGPRLLLPSAVPGEETEPEDTVEQTPPELPSREPDGLFGQRRVETPEDLREVLLERKAASLLRPGISDQNLEVHGEPATVGDHGSNVVGDNRSIVDSRVIRASGHWGVGSSSHQVTRKPSLVASDSSLVGVNGRLPKQSLGQAFARLFLAGESDLRDQLQAAEQELTAQQRRDLITAGKRGVGLVAVAERVVSEVKESPSLPRRSPERSRGGEGGSSSHTTEAAHTIRAAKTARPVPVGR